MAEEELKIRISAEVKSITGALKKIRKELGSVDKAGKKAGEGAQQGFGKLEGAIKNVKSQLVGLIGVYAAFRAVKGIIQQADDMKRLNARLKLVTSSTEEFTKAQKALFEISQRSRSGLGETVDLYTRIARSTKQIGVSQSTILQVTETINQAIQISGVSAQAANAALVQLGQGLASGTLRGDELRSVLEQTPRLAEAIAEGMGVTIGKLRELGQDGKLTAETILGALSQQSDAIQKEFDQIPVTVGQALTQINNAWLDFLRTVDQSSGTTAAFASVLQVVAENFKTIISILIKFGALVVAAFAVKGVLSVKAYIVELQLAIAAQGGVLAGVTKLRAGFLLLFAAVAGWEIGTILRDKFAVVRKAGIAMVSGIQVAFARLIAYSKIAALGLKLAFTLPIDFIRQKFADLFSAIASGVRLIPGAGASAADGLEFVAKKLEPIVSAAQDFRTRVAGINAQLKKDVLEIKDSYADAFALEDKGAVAKGISDSAKKVGDTLKILADNSKNQIKLLQDEADRALRALDRLRDLDLIGVQDYYHKRAAIQTAALDREIAAQRAALAAETKESKKADLIREITILERQRAEVSVESAHQIAAANKGIEDALNQVRIATLKSQGETVEARRLELEKQYEKTIKFLRAKGDKEGEALIKGLINTEVARAQLAKLKRDFDLALQELKNKELVITAKEETGEISSFEATKQIGELRSAQLPILEELRQATKRLYDETKDPRVLAALEQMNAKLVTAKKATDTFAKGAKDAFESGLTGFLTDIATGAKSAGEAFRDMARSFIVSLAKMAAQALAKQAAFKLFGASGGGGFLGSIFSSVNHTGGIAGQGGTRRNVSPLLFAGAPRYHGGGIAGLQPGEVPSILKKGEEVLTESDPRHAANGGGASQAKGTRIINVIDPALVSDYMTSSEGEEVLINMIERNSGSIKQVLA